MDEAFRKTRRSLKAGSLEEKASLWRKVSLFDFQAFDFKTPPKHAVAADAAPLRFAAQMNRRPLLMLFQPVILALKDHTRTSICR